MQVNFDLCEAKEVVVTIGFRFQMSLSIFC